jgi:hypothetical protein
LAFDSDSDGEDDGSVTKQLQQLAVTDSTSTSSSSSTAGIKGSSSSSSTDASSSAQQLQSLQRETEELKAAVAHWKGRAESSAKLIAELTREVRLYTNIIY